MTEPKHKIKKEKRPKSRQDKGDIKEMDDQDKTIFKKDKNEDTTQEKARRIHSHTRENAG
jgi:hypothetical protein